MNTKFRTMFEHSATILFVAFIAFGLGYSLYKSVWSTADDKAAKAIENQIKACDKALARATVFENFALEAASARRRNADKLAEEDSNIAAQNEIATAKKYESYAKQWDALTVHNCRAEYGSS